MLLYYQIHETRFGKSDKCLASLTFYHFSPTCCINSMKHEHSCKIFYINKTVSNLMPVLIVLHALLICFLCVYDQEEHAVPAVQRQGHDQSDLQYQARGCGHRKVKRATGKA